MLIFISCTVWEEDVLALLSNLQHLGLLWSEHLQTQELWWDCSSTDSLPQQLRCSFVQQLQLTGRGVATKSEDAIQVSLRNPPDVINTSAFKISVKKKSGRPGNVHIAKTVFFFSFNTFTVTFIVRNRDIWFFGRHSDRRR